MSKKKLRLSREEQALEDSFGTSQWKELPASERRKVERAAARSVESRRKVARVNVRMSELDVSRLKERAHAEGLPYQSLMSSIIHKYVTEQLVEKKYVDEIAKRLRKGEDDEAA